jgi:hypothetical protein
LFAWGVPHGRTPSFATLEGGTSPSISPVTEHCLLKEKAIFFFDVGLADFTLI